jgi:hypothetical protein
MEDIINEFVENINEDIEKYNYWGMELEREEAEMIIESDFDVRSIIKTKINIDVEIEIKVDLINTKVEIDVRRK